MEHRRSKIASENRWLITIQAKATSYLPFSALSPPLSLTSLLIRRLSRHLNIQLAESRFSNQQEAIAFTHTFSALYGQKNAPCTEPTKKNRAVPVSAFPFSPTWNAYHPDLVLDSALGDKGFDQKKKTLGPSFQLHVGQKSHARRGNRASSCRGLTPQLQ
jgi:hypothetical protein